MSSDLSESFRLSLESLNDKANDSSRRPDPLPNTRVDMDVQFAYDDPFDAFQKACKQMDFK